MKSYLFFIFLLTPFISEASSWRKCQYKLKIKSKSNQSISVRVIAHLGGQGMAGLLSKKTCAKYLYSNKIKLEKITQGIEFVKVGSVVMATRNDYLAMGPKGTVSGTSWKLISANK